MVKQPVIIHQDEGLLVLDKPSGWIVNRCQTTRGKETIQDWLGKNYAGQMKTIDQSGYRNGIVHRLDKGTSGILLVAKTPAVFEDLQRQFYQRRVEKEYLVLVHGRFPPKDQVKAAVGRLPWDREKFGVIPGGKKAQTTFIFKKGFIYQGNDYSLLTARPKTGRTHQIRVHLKYAGRPVVADPDYVGKNRLQRDLVWCPRIFLHASRIQFSHPLEQRRVEFFSPLPEELEKVLERLEGQREKETKKQRNKETKERKTRKEGRRGLVIKCK